MQYFDSDIFPAQKSFLSVSGHIKIFPVLRLPSNEFCEDFLGHLNQKRIFTHFRIPLDSCFLILSDSYDMFCYSKMTFASLLICSILFSLRWLIKNWPAMWEIWVRSLCWEDPLEKGKATQYSGLEKSTDCIVHAVAKSQTRLRDITFTFFHFQSADSNANLLGLLRGQMIIMRPQGQTQSFHMELISPLFCMFQNA